MANSLSKWSNYPNSIREKNTLNYPILFGYLRPNFLGYFMNREFFFEDTVKLRVLTRLVLKHMQAFSDCL